MQDFRTTELETVSMEGQEPCPTYAVHVGLDVHKDSIAVALAPAGREPPVYYGEIANRPPLPTKPRRSPRYPCRPGRNGTSTPR